MTQLALIPEREPLGIAMRTDDIAVYRAARMRALAAGWRVRRDVYGVTWSRPFEWRLWATGSRIEIYQIDETRVGIEYRTPTTTRTGPSTAGWTDTVTVRSMAEAVAVLDALGLLPGAA